MTKMKMRSVIALLSLSVLAGGCAVSNLSSLTIPPSHEVSKAKDPVPAVVEGWDCGAFLFSLVPVARARVRAAAADALQGTTARTLKDVEVKQVVVPTVVVHLECIRVRGTPVPPRTARPGPPRRSELEEARDVCRTSFGRVTDFEASAETVELCARAAEKSSKFRACVRDASDGDALAACYGMESEP